MHPLINQIEELFLPEMQRLASDLQKQYPALQFKVWRGPVGSLTEYQGYALGVDCLFPKVPQNATNNVALCVDVCHLTSAPRLMAEVGWGQPSGQSEATFRDDLRSNDDWPEATPEIIEELKETFPSLIEAFRSSVARGTPPVQPKKHPFDGAGWQRYESGATVGSRGSERGVIVLDEEHPADARITLERNGETAPFAITCGLGGWFVHTVFFSTEREAEKAFESMRADLDAIIQLVPSATDFTRDQMKAVEDAIEHFV